MQELNTANLSHSHFFMIFDWLEDSDIHVSHPHRQIHLETSCQAKPGLRSIISIGENKSVVNDSCASF